MKTLMLAVMAFMMSGAALAKLPTPNPEAKAKADETKNKTAWTDKVAAYQLCKSQDKVAATYLKSAKGADKKPESGLPSCTDPGPYVAQSGSQQVGVADAKPVPEAGAAPTTGTKK